ncbi:MAG TPA: NF038129 family PEP-CTERM protein [Bryobacteraceae bacterium]|nr:NF038129 family PEP-CTERM protein [Bryobacteraceae bacterium]
MLRLLSYGVASRLAAVAGLLLLGSTAASAAVIYQVTVDTSAFASESGFLDLQFNGLAGSDPATAEVSSFSGGTLVGAPTTTGSVSGTLPGPVTFVNDDLQTSYLQALLFGSSFQFYLTLDGDAINAPSGSPLSETFFSISLYNADLTANLGPADPLLGSAGYVRIAGDGTLDPQAAGPDPIVTFTEVDTIVPEPSTWVLSSGALLALAVTSRLRARSRSERP